MKKTALFAPVLVLAMSFVTAAGTKEQSTDGTVVLSAPTCRLIGK